MKKDTARSRKTPAPETAVKYPARVWLPAALLAALVVAASFDFYGASSRYQQSNRDPYRIAVQVERFRPAAEVLPPDSVAGYVSDLSAGETAGKSAFLSAQYALAPRLLVEANSTPPPRMAIGNFSRPKDYAAEGRPFDLDVDRDLGNGVVLFRRAGH